MLIKKDNMGGRKIHTIGKLHKINVFGPLTPTVHPPNITLYRAVGSKVS